MAEVDTVAREVIKNLDGILGTGNKDADVEVLVEQAEKLGKELGKNKKASTSQIRNVFSSVKNMAGYNKRELQLLRPKLAYLRSRSSKIAPLEEVLQEAIPRVQDEDTFKQFQEFFEAVVAYHQKYEN